jgi:hypothetical protein
MSSTLSAGAVSAMLFISFPPTSSERVTAGRLFQVGIAGIVFSELFFLEPLIYLQHKCKLFSGWPLFIKR